MNGRFDSKRSHDMALMIELSDLPARFEEALAYLRVCGEVVLTVDSVPLAGLTALPTPPRTEPFKLGLHPGAMVMAPDFDDPLPDEFWLGEA